MRQPPFIPPGRFLELSGAGRIRSIEKYNDLIGNQTRYIPSCNIVPQPTTLLRASLLRINIHSKFAVNSVINAHRNPKAALTL
jgi:hypothetical protein